MIAILLLAVLPQGIDPPADSLPPDLPRISYHLTARPWKPLGIPTSAYLDRIEGECRFWKKHQDSTGAIIDPYLQREWQYSTPYYAYAVGTLISAGRAKDLLESGLLAMDCACASFASGKTDGHSEFFVPPLTEAIPLFAPHVVAARSEAWRHQMTTVFKPGGTNNWRTYFMKGQWLRVKAGLISVTSATSDIERDWTVSQEARIGPTRWNLYHDWSSDPDTLAVEVVGRGNLMALFSAGYSGPSRDAIETAVERGSLTAFLMQDPSGQGPANGRTDDHVWGDAGHQAAFETMAERSHTRGDVRLAGQYRRAALLAFRNLDRWRRTEGEWAGSFFVTKNRFDPSFRVGYQPASQYSNYNGALAYHTAEAFVTRRTELPEQPTPAEIGGYAFATDSSFAAAFANAGGMAMEIDLRGQTQIQFNQFWTALGVVRLGRSDWETRLGPSDGRRDPSSGEGVSFAPTWQESGRWIRLANVPDRYQGTFVTSFAHPLLTRCAVTWKPIPGRTGPTFHQDFTLTPDGIFSEVLSEDAGSEWGMTVPLLASDGSVTLEHAIRASEKTASVSFPGGQDSQNFMVISPDPVAMTSEPVVRSSYGDLLPIRVTGSGPSAQTFVYPRGPQDPAAAAVRETFRRTPGGFASILGRVQGTLYVGRTSAGGFGASISIGEKDPVHVSFTEPCGFILQLSSGSIAAVEVDRAVRMTVGTRSFQLVAYTPFSGVGDERR